MKVNKGKAFVIGVSSVLLLSLVSLIMLKDSAVVSAGIVGIVGCTTAFIAGNVADNGVKGANYREELDREKNTSTTCCAPDSM